MKHLVPSERLICDLVELPLLWLTEVAVLRFHPYVNLQLARSILDSHGRQIT
jgi:hypothetical protein